MNKGDDKVINAFHSNCRKILRIRWQDNVRKGKLLERAKMKPLIDEVLSKTSENDWSFPEVRQT